MTRYNSAVFDRSSIHLLSRADTGLRVLRYMKVCRKDSLHLSALLRDTTTYPALRAPQLIAVYRRLQPLYTSRYTVWLLIGLSVLRAVIFLIAYPPAHGADSADYFLYAAQFEGLDAPVVFQLIYPLYPLLIYLTHYVLGSVYVLIGAQIVLSVFQGPLFYWGFKPYSPAVGFLVALIVIGDAQTGILYNFTSTEPIYMFVLSLAFCLFLRQTRNSSEWWFQTGDLLLGLTLALALLARPVGRYLIVPFAILFFLGTLQWRRTGVLVASFAVALVLATGFNQLVFDRLELTGGGTFMLSRPLMRSGLLEADNGPVSAQVVELRAACPEGEGLNRCLVQELGDWPTVRRLYEDAYQEMLQSHPREFAEKVIGEFHDFMRLPGLQYRGAVTPSDVQCADIDTKVARDTASYLEKDWILYGASDLTAETLSPIMHDIATAMCPAWSDNDTVRQRVDQVAVRYRSLSRPYWYVWYALLGMLLLLIPWARHRWLIPVLLAGGILVNHAAASALTLNVQPRYIAVMNPYKGILLIVLLYILVMLVVRMADAALTRTAGEGDHA